jgi:hypothetical protein
LVYVRTVPVANSAADSPALATNVSDGISNPPALHASYEAFGRTQSYFINEEDRSDGSQWGFDK